MDLYNDPTFVASERLDTMATNGMLAKPVAKAAKHLTTGAKKPPARKRAHRRPRANA